MFTTVSPTFRRRRELLREGLTDRELARAVADGRLLRPRQNLYLPPDAHPDLVDACAVGGRLTCVSELARRGVFVLEAARLHVHLRDLRPPRPGQRRPLRLHWGRLSRTPHPAAAAVEVFDALREAIRCQPARAAVATLDSALHLGLVAESDLGELFASLPARYGVVAKLSDKRAESGPESLVRLILRSIGAAFELQVQIDGVGRVDFVVNGWLIIECDSRAHHAEWEAQRRDRRRDQAAAALGYATLRLVAEDIMWSPERVRAAVAGLLGGHFRARVRR